MALLADITVFDQWGQICALVEVKARPETDADWAAELRQDILDDYGFVPRYFLVVARDWSYLWTTAASKDSPPDERHATAQIFAPYLEAIHTDAVRIAASALELTVGIWLTDLIARNANHIATEWALPSGFAEAVENGRIEFLDAA